MTDTDLPSHRECLDGCKLCRTTPIVGFLGCGCSCHDCASCRASTYGPCRAHRPPTKDNEFVGARHNDQCRHPELCPPDGCTCWCHIRVGNVEDLSELVVTHICSLDCKPPGHVLDCPNGSPLIRKCESCRRRHHPDESCPTVEQPTKEEAVDHPSHYNGDTPHEHVKCAEAWGLVQNSHLYNATKYICRAGRKGDLVEDLRKARWYLDRAILRAQAQRDQYPTCPTCRKVQEDCGCNGLQL
jgi:hypothetical protein